MGSIFKDFIGENCFPYPHVLFINVFIKNQLSLIIHITGKITNKQRNWLSDRNIFFLFCIQPAFQRINRYSICGFQAIVT